MDVFFCIRGMYRSFILIGVFMFFSVALPCMCSDGTFSLATDDSCVMSDSGTHVGESERGVMGMNLLDHIASWRAFFSSSFPVAFFFVVLVLLSVFGQKEWFVRFARISLSRRGIFHPLKYFDERVLISCPIRRALYTGVLHAKISY